MKINLFHQISLVLDLVILAFISCYLLLMKEINPLMKGLVRLEESVFFDISKTFNKAWNDDIIFRLTQYEIIGRFYKTFLQDLLKERKQRPNLRFLHRKLSMLEYLCVPFWILYCFWFKRMTLQKDWLHDTQAYENHFSKDFGIINDLAF